MNCFFALQLQLADYSGARQDTDMRLGDMDEVGIKREEERVAFEV